MLFINADIVNEGRRFLGYLSVRDGLIETVGEGLPSSELVAMHHGEVEDLEGKLLIPGAIDTHVHFREPGLTHKADIHSESLLAREGGVTSYIDMPNCRPATTTLEAWEYKLKRAAEVSAANYAFFLGATNENASELMAFKSPYMPGIKLFMGSSTGGMLVDDKATLEEFFSYRGIVAVHSEDEGIIRQNVEAVRGKFGEDEVPISLHPAIRSREACIASTRSAIDAALKHDTRLHLLHVSTREEVEMLRALPAGHHITAEACVAHLWFCSDDYSRKGAAIKCNPAIKDAEDREALRHSVADGTIATVATDHAPHLWEEKQGGSLKGASGMPMLPYSLPAMLTLASEGVLSVERVVELMCHNPARLFGIKERGYLRPGYHADLAIVDTDADYVVSHKDLHNKCGWSPMEGERLTAKVLKTYINGSLEGKAMPVEFLNTN